MTSPQQQYSFSFRQVLYHSGRQSFKAISSCKNKFRVSVALIVYGPLRYGKQVNVVEDKNVLPAQRDGISGNKILVCII